MEEEVHEEMEDNEEDEDQGALFDDADPGFNGRGDGDGDSDDHRPRSVVVGDDGNIDEPNEQTIGMYCLYLLHYCAYLTLS